MKIYGFNKQILPTELSLKNIVYFFFEVRSKIDLIITSTITRTYFICEYDVVKTSDNGNYISSYDNSWVPSYFTHISSHFAALVINSSYIMSVRKKM